MSDNYKYEKSASTAVKFLGWLTFIPLITITALRSSAFSSLDGYYSSSLFTSAAISIAVMIMLLVFYITVGNNIKMSKKWAKSTGAVIGVLYLFAFPIGTVIGGALLYFLIKGWNETSNVTDSEIN